MVTTTDPTPPPSARIGVALIQRPDAAAVGDREHDLLGAHGLAGAELLLQRDLGQGHLAPVGAADRDHLQELLGRVADRPQALDDAPRLAVERDRPAGAGVEDHDPDRRGLDQGLAPALWVRRAGQRRGGLRPADGRAFRGDAAGRSGDLAPTAGTTRSATASGCCSRGR